MDFPPKVVASVTSIEEAKDAKKLGTDIIEVRVDLLHGDALSAVESIFSLGVPLIITVRPEYEGGRFKGSDRERVEIFGSLAQYAAFIDVELKARTLDDIISTTKGTDALPIVSYHNFKKKRRQMQKCYAHWIAVRARAASLSLRSCRIR